MAMLSITPPHFHHLHSHRRCLFLLPSNPKPAGNHHLTIKASRLPTRPPPPPPGSDLYQPFRPPPAPLPTKYRSLDPSQRLEILRDRLGLWHEYAPLLTSLSHDGFTPPSIEELTGITGVEQNRLQVAARVRDTLLPPSSPFPPDLLPFFDSPVSAELLYELRLLNAAQRAAAAELLVNQNLDGRATQELARAIRDFPRRRSDDGWASFAADSPGDCLAFTRFRLSREAIAADDRIASLERALEVAESDEAKERITIEINRASGGATEEAEVAAAEAVPVVRLRYGEAAKAKMVVVLPVVRTVEEVGMVPGWCRVDGMMGVVEAEKGWGRWVVLPGWGPLVEMGGEGGVAVEFGDESVLPWKGKRGERVVVVVDRRRREVEDDDFYLVVGGEVGMRVERGGKLGEEEVLGRVVLVVRPRREEEEDQLGDEDWV